jgi:glycosyltransferase involved in cell wall biosynthesis
LNVLYVIAHFGADRLGNLIHRELGHAFQERGHRFDVLAFASASELQAHAIETVEDGIQVHRAPVAGTLATDAVNAATKPLLHYDRFATGTWAIRSYFARRRDQAQSDGSEFPLYDVAFIEGAYPFGAMCALAVPSATKLLVTVAGGDFINSPATNYGYGRFRSARGLMRRALQRAAAVRVTTPLVRERALALGAAPERIALIPRNIASYCFPPAQASLAEFRAEARRALAVRYQLGDARVIAAVGRLLPIKGFDRVLRALPQILQWVGDTRLLIVGPSRSDPSVGDYRRYLENLALELGVADKTIFTGEVPHKEMRTLLAGVDVIAVPSVLEGMNKIAVEGTAVGTPAVVTRTAGIADLLEKAEAGVVVGDNSPAALGEALVQLLSDDSLRARLAANGLPFAAQFSSEAIGAQLISLCERIQGVE